MVIYHRSHLWREPETTIDFLEVKMALLWHMDVMSSGQNFLLWAVCFYTRWSLFLPQVLIFFLSFSTKKHRNAREFSFTNNYLRDVYILLFILGIRGFFRATKHHQKCHRRDKEFIMLAVALNGLCLQYASVELRSDRQVVLQAIRSNPYAFLGYQNIYKRLVFNEMVKLHGECWKIVFGCFQK